MKQKMPRNSYLKIGFNQRKDLGDQAYRCQEGEHIYIDFDFKTKSYQVGIWRSWKMYEQYDSNHIINNELPEIPDEEIEIFNPNIMRLEKLKLSDRVHGLKFKKIRK